MEAILTLVSGLLATIATVQEPASSVLSGTWELELVRDNYAPHVSFGALELAHGETGWTGSLGFDRILHAKPWPLEAVSVEGSKLAFELRGADCELRFEGELEGGRLAGTCHWKDLGDYPWTAKRPGPVELFDAEPTEDDPFPRAQPEEVGLQRAALLDLVRAAQRSGSDALVVVADGRLVCDRFFAGERRPIEAMSTTKSIAGLAVGLALDAGEIQSIDQPVHEWFAEWSDEARREITLRHILTQTAGLETKPTTEDIYASPDFVQFALAARAVAPPGTRFAYDNRATNLVAGIVEVATETPLDELLGARLFEPLGITDWSWTRDAAGNPHAMSGLQIRALDLARLGALMLDGGTWKGERVLSADWIADSLLATEVGEGHVDYGLLWWLIPRAPRDGEEEPAWTVPGCSPDRAAAMRPLDAFWAQGYLGQYLVVAPAKRIVAVRQRADPERGDEFGSFQELVRALARSDGN